LSIHGTAYALKKRLVDWIHKNAGTATMNHMKHHSRSRQNNITHLIVGGLILTILNAGYPDFALSENLDAAFKAALEQDYCLKSANDSVAAAEETLSAAKALRLPSITGEASYTIFDTIPATSVSLSPLLPTLNLPMLEDDRVLMSDITVSVPVFTSFRISHAVHGAEAAMEAGRSDQLKTIQDIKLKTAEAYVTVLRAEHSLVVAKSNVTALSAHAIDVENYYSKGLVPKNDVLAVHVALADARQTAIKVENALALARAAYNRQVGRQLDSDVLLDDPASEMDFGAASPDKNPRDLDAVTRRALENRSEIKKLSDQARAVSFRAKSIRAAALPQVQISGSFYHLTNTPLDDENIWTGSLGVRWDLFDGGVIRHQARAEEKKRAALENMKRETETLISLQVRQSFLDVEETAKRLLVTRDAMGQAEENLKIAKNRYIREIGNNTEVLDAETLRVNTMTNHVNAVYDRVMAGLRLKRASGDL
jgi:outer membrane protein TolC